MTLLLKDTTELTLIAVIVTVLVVVAMSIDLVAGVTVLVIFGIICLLLSMCACKTQYKVVEVPRVVTQTNVEHHTNIVRDTLLRRDSVIIVQRGDTIYHETWHHLQAINRTYIADTVRDTIPLITTQKIKGEGKVECVLLS